MMKVMKSRAGWVSPPQNLGGGSQTVALPRKQKGRPEGST